jgi:TPR repeat protein
VVAVLPAAYWPPRLREEWLAAGEAKRGQRFDAQRLRQRMIDALKDPARRESLQQDMDFQSGAMYFHGESLPRNYVTARERWEAGCRAGNPFAMVGLGLIHQNGLGTPIDVARARQCFQAAAERGLDFGDYELGRSYLVEGNADMAQMHLRRAAQLGYAPDAIVRSSSDAGA